MPFYPYFGESSPTKIDYRNKIGYQLILTSLEDLAIAAMASSGSFHRMYHKSARPQPPPGLSEQSVAAAPASENVSLTARESRGLRFPNKRGGEGCRVRKWVGGWGAQNWFPLFDVLLLFGLLGPLCFPLARQQQLVFRWCPNSSQEGHNFIFSICFPLREVQVTGHVGVSQTCDPFCGWLKLEKAVGGWSGLVHISRSRAIPRGGLGA